MVAVSIAGAGCNPDINTQGINTTMTTKNEQPATLPRPPLKIPMPLDKAGYKVDVTFEVPPLPRGEAYLSNLIGLRVLFTPGTGKVPDVLEERSVTVRLFLYRIEDDKEIRIPLFNRAKRSSPNAPPRQGEVSEISKGEAIASLYYAEHHDTQHDVSTLVLALAGAKKAVTPGLYRFQVETLENIPALRGVTSFFVYEELLKR